MASILVLGDSVMKGVVFDSLKQKYTLIRNGVVARFMRETKIDVTNVSLFGATITKGAQQWMRRSDRLDGVRYALLEFGGNDCDFDWKAIAEHPERVHRPHTTLEEFAHRYEALIDDLRKKEITPLVMTLPPLDPDRFFKTISRGLDASRLLAWLGGSTDAIYRWHEAYNLAILNVSLKTCVPVIDVRSAFLVRKDYRRYLCEDGMHPNEKGHQLILDVVLAFIRQQRLVPDAPPPKHRPAQTSTPRLSTATGCVDV